MGAGRAACATQGPAARRTPAPARRLRGSRPRGRTAASTVASQAWWLGDRKGPHHPTMPSTFSPPIAVPTSRRLLRPRQPSERVRAVPLAPAPPQVPRRRTSATSHC